MKILTLILVAILYSVTGSDDRFKKVCYLLSYNKTKSNYLIDPSEMKWELCSHLIFSFASVKEGLIDADLLMTSYIDKMVRHNHTEVKYMISVGGSYFPFVKNTTLAERFADSVVDFIKKHNLNGLDIDWEFPYLTNDKNNFSNLLKIIRLKFDQELKERKRSYILSVALTPIIYIAERSYHVPSISKYVDFVNLMTYDYHTPNTIPYTSYNAPLFGTKFDILYLKYFNVFFSVNYMHRLGLRKDQIMVGIPFYGYLYFLVNEKFHDLFALANGTQVSASFSDICGEEKLPTSTKVFDRISKVPYLYNGKRWISYDDIESITIKSQWIVDNNLGGSMSFALNHDDFKSNCNMGAFPLQTAIYDVLN